jgi:hypothetical protein
MDIAYATIAIDELVKFLGQEKYVKGMPTLLTDLYDAPEIRTGGGTLSGVELCLRQVFINFISASTPSWLLRAVNPDVIEGGFTSRVMFVVAEEAKASYPFPGEVNEALRQEIELASCQMYVIKLQELNSTFLLAKGHVKGSQYGTKSRDKKRDPFRASFQSREDAHVLRLAALLSISDGLWEIQANHISIAIRVITETREDGATIFEGTGTNTRLVLSQQTPYGTSFLLRGMGGIKQGDLTKVTARKSNTLTRLKQS